MSVCDEGWESGHDCGGGSGKCPAVHVDAYWWCGFGLWAGDGINEDNLSCPHAHPIKEALAGKGWLVCVPNESDFVAAIMPGDGHLEAASWGRSREEA